MPWREPRTLLENTTGNGSNLSDMYTYDVVTESIRNPHELAAELSKRSQAGWEVVEIVYDGAAWFHAFIRHHGTVATAPTPATVSSLVTTPVSATAAVANVPPMTEPGTQATPSPEVPANWYKDPSGRYELRYWNGTTWTEHVATGGKQFTDPPKA